MQLGFTKSKLPKDNTIKQTYNLFNQNKKQLGFIPFLFVILVICLSLVAGFWFVKYRRDENSQVAGSFDKKPTLEELVNNSNNQLNLKNSDLQKSEISTSSSITSIFNEQQILCTLELSKNLPANLDVIFQKSDSRFWQVQDNDNCTDKNLVLVQIIKLSQEEYLGIEDKFSSKNLQLLDEKSSIYALIYTKNNVQTNYNFQTFLKYLVEPVFADQKYLQPQNISDTKYVENFTYYLEGTCRSDNEYFCNLWRINNFNGQTEFLKQRVAQNSLNHSSKIKNVESVRFAKNQDIKDAINLILVNSSSVYTEFKLITLDINTWNIIQSFVVYPADKTYFDYLR